VIEPATPSASDSSEKSKATFQPPDKHVAADRAGKVLGQMAGSINKALGADDEPVVLNRRGRHVSIKSLEELIDKALDS
jgi:hypothetical protein